MTRYNILKALLAVAILACVHGAMGQGQTAPRADALTKPARIREEMPSQSNEGIHVHGHWAVTVRNIDGTVASRHEFENSVTDLGKGIVLGFLSGSTYPMQGYVPSWELKVGEKLCSHHTPPARKNQDDCLIPVKAELVVGGKVEMKGTVTIEYPGQIKSVATQITNTITPGGSSPIVFSSRDLTQPDSVSGQAAVPINVQTGQNVDFVVDISIS
jgi:hypothetical protein